MKYTLLYSDTNKDNKEIIRGTSGTFGTLAFKIVDSSGAIVNFTGLDVVAKIYIGVEGTLKVNGTTLTSTTPASGLATYAIAWSDFPNDAAAGRFDVELYLADNASPTKIISTSTAILRVRQSIID